MTNTQNLSIYAQALIDNSELSNARITGDIVGPSNARTWIAAVKALRIPAYAIRVYRVNHMGDTTKAEPCDMSAFFNALRPIIDMIGEVQGAKLFPENVAEELIGCAMVKKSIDISEEMAHARLMRKKAKEAYDNNSTDENEANYEAAKAEFIRLKAIPGNCKDIDTITPEGAFIKNIEHKLSVAITKQSAKSVEEVQAEIKAREDARKAKAKANRQAKRQAKAQAETTNK